MAMTVGRVVGSVHRAPLTRDQCVDNGPGIIINNVSRPLRRGSCVMRSAATERTLAPTERIPGPQRAIGSAHVYMTEIEDRVSAPRPRIAIRVRCVPPDPRRPHIPTHT